MTKREELHELLCSALGSRHCYFNPPETIKMQYPAIVYNRSTVDVRHADNDNYSTRIEYQVTVIDEDPDSPIVEAVMGLPYCRYNRHFVSDNLNHDVFKIYY